MKLHSHHGVTAVASPALSTQLPKTNSCRHSCTAPQAQSHPFQHSSRAWQRRGCTGTFGLTATPADIFHTHRQPRQYMYRRCGTQSHAGASTQCCCCCCCCSRVVCADPQARAWSKGRPASEPRPLHQQDVLERRLSHPSAKEP
jgi:hypothetical protein